MPSEFEVWVANYLKITSGLFSVALTAAYSSKCCFKSRRVNGFDAVFRPEHENYFILLSKRPVLDKESDISLSVAFCFYIFGIFTFLGVISLLIFSNFTVSSYILIKLFI